MAPTQNMTNELRSALKQTFGFDQFRTGQEQTIRQLLAGESSLAIFPTGSGKSLCYQWQSYRFRFNNNNRYSEFARGR